MKQKFIGCYSLGNEYVELYAKLDEDGGTFYFQPEKKRLGRIKVGFDYNSWDRVVSVLLHECFEYAMTRKLSRYESCNPDYSRNHAAYLFVMDHNMFTGICSEVASFITEALPALAAEYKEIQKRRMKQSQNHRR